MTRPKKQYQLMQDAISGKNFKDRNGRVYTAVNVDIHLQQITADYHDGHPPVNLSFFDSHGNTLVSENQTSHTQKKQDLSGRVAG